MMTKYNGSICKSDIQALLELLQHRLLDLLGGQDLRNSGFENEEPNPEFGRRDEPWHN